MDRLNDLDLSVKACSVKGAKVGFRPPKNLVNVNIISAVFRSSCKARILSLLYSVKKKNPVHTLYKWPMLQGQEFQLISMETSEV